MREPLPFNVFAISLILFLIFSTNQAFAQMPDSIFGKAPSILDNNGEELIEDDSSEIMIPEKGVFERIERNVTGDK